VSGPHLPGDDPDVVTEPREVFIDPDGFTPRLIALLSNALVWRESGLMRERFGIATNDWRVLSALAMRPGMPASEISEFLVVNKAVVSKSVTALARRGLIALREGPRGSRPMFLTTAGAELHDELLPISMRGQEIILDGLPADEVERLNALLVEMLRRVQLAQSTGGIGDDPSADGARDA
jgi:DNA-binding MarR family transcriptional regulator